MKILVTGDRNWKDKEYIKRILSQYPSSTVLIHGAASGADALAAECALELGMEVIGVPANWEKYGKAAGPIRNSKMLDLNPDLVLAFHEDLSRSKGTQNCVFLAQKRGIEVILYTNAL